MELSEQLSKIIDLFEKSLSSNSTTIAIWSVIISILALITTIVFNIITHRQYIRSLDPLLSFDFFESGYELYLSITNTGQSFARDIKIEIKEIINNEGNKGDELDELFKKEFTLYPKEKVQGIIATSGKNITNKIFPVLKVKMSYIKGNTNKFESYERTITFTRLLKNEINLHYIEEKLNSLSLSTVRLANYIEGRFLFASDELNVVPASTLYRDMRDVFNKTKRKKGKHPTLTEELDKEESKRVKQTKEEAKN